LEKEEKEINVIKFIKFVSLCILSDIMEYKKRLLKGASLVFAAAVIVGACAPRTQYVPYPSSGSTTFNQHNKNVIECEAWARRQPGADPQRALNEGAKGAVGLGLLGAVLGALAGDAKLGGLAGASIGAAGVGAYGAQQAQEIYNRALNDCMRNK
tara:strand:+ start:617 stop:1081 length:465 start_codon:yes stop_codon:yes gene_type:complete